MSRFIASALIAVLLCAACQQDEPPVRAGTPARVTRDSAPAAAAAATTTTTAIDTTAVFFVEATPAELDSLRSRYSEDDYAVVGDDMMWYRATAAESLEKWGIPFAHMDGRRPLHFMVNGAPVRLDFGDVELTDFLIAYRRNEQPRVFAPVDIEALRAFLQPATSAER